LRENKTETTVLGIQWNRDSDEMSLVSPAPQPLKNTMREVFKLHAKLYDPLGWVIPVAIRAKMLLQRCHIKKYTWNTQLDEDETKVWHNIYKDLLKVAEIRILRNLQADNSVFSNTLLFRFQ